MEPKFPTWLLEWNNGSVCEASLSVDKTLYTWQSLISSHSGFTSPAIQSNGTKMGRALLPCLNYSVNSTFSRVNQDYLQNLPRERSKYIWCVLFKVSENQFKKFCHHFTTWFLVSCILKEANMKLSALSQIYVIFQIWKWK